MGGWYCHTAKDHEWHGPYHDEEYGVPRREDAKLFELLVMEMFQTGLSWLAVLKKRDGLRRAFADWDMDKVAEFGLDEIEALLANPEIVRNRAKIVATIDNARRLVDIRARHGSIANWLDAHHPSDKMGWVKAFKAEGLKFVGPEVANSYLMSLGYLPGAHTEDCPRYLQILTLNPPWVQAGLS